MARKKRSSASGEVAAIRGYGRQYEYAACLIYRHMQSGDLQSLIVGCEEAGPFDDILITTATSLSATQVKSEVDPKSVNVRTELIDNKLIVDMAESWLSLGKISGGRRVSLRYVFGGYFSRNDVSLANPSASGGKRHSAEFARFLNRTDLTPGDVDGSQWSDTLAAFQKLSNLSDADFLFFINSIELFDRDELQRNLPTNFPPREKRFVEDIKHTLPDLVMGADEKSVWTEVELVQKLGWQSRLSQRNSHVFPVPEDFQENDPTTDALIKGINENVSGYLSLLGPPGTGKSTLLQRAIFSNADFSVSRYLAFVPNDRHGLGRAEAGEFLNDLIAELRSLGFEASRYSIDDLSSLRSELQSQLVQAHNQFKRTNRKTVIVIDGLDHIPQEENPTASFLSELPAAHAVPEGILFILGSQHLELSDVHASIQQQAGAPGRRIDISPLSRAAVFAMADAAPLPHYIEREDVYLACLGHPLTARYLIGALRGASTREEAERILSHDRGIGVALEQIYARVWKAVAPKADQKRGLGLLARAEGGLTPQQLASIVGDEAVEGMLEEAGFLLSEAKGCRLSIFHNSFRLFIISETSKRFLKTDQGLELEFNRTLAAIAEMSDKNDPQYWMRLRYIARAGQNDQVLLIGTPEYFRQSLAAFRSRSDVAVDLRLVYAAIKPTRSRQYLLRALLIEKEVEYRLEAVTDLDLIDISLRFGDVEKAVVHALDLDGAAASWLNLVDVLWSDGQYELARRVFERNEPLELLFGRDRHSTWRDVDAASEWVKRAHRFRPLERLLNIIENIPFDEAFVREGQGDEMRSRIKFALARGIIADSPTASVDELTLKIGLNEEHTACLQVEAASERVRVGASELARTALLNLPETNVGLSWRISAARLAVDLSEKMLASSILGEVDLRGIKDRDENLEHKCILIYNVLSLSAILGTKYTLSPPEGAFSATIQAKIVELAAIRSSASGNDDKMLARRLLSVVTYVSQFKPDWRDHVSHKFLGLLSMFCALIVRISRKIGTETFRGIVAEIDKRCDEIGNNIASSEAFRLAFAKEVFLIDGDVDGARNRISHLRDTERHGRTPQDVVSSRAAIASAYADIGCIEEAQASLDSIHQDTFGYWLRAKKEPQYEFWIWSYTTACAACPGKASDHALEFARFLIGMDLTEGDETARRVVPDLLTAPAVSMSAIAGIVKRLTETDLTSWHQIVECILTAVVKSENPRPEMCLELFARLYVPFAGRGSSFLPAALSSSLLATTIRPEVIHRLVEAVMTWAPPTSRALILSDVAAAIPDDVAVNTALAQAEARLEQVRGRTTGSETSQDYTKEFSSQSLQELLLEGSGESSYSERVDYSYARAAEALVQFASLVEIEAFILQRPILVHDARFLIACARRNLSEGNRRRATELFGLAERAAFSGHWSTFMGGQKISLQQLRVELFGESGRESGFDTLIDELAAGQTSGTSLFLNLDQVMESISVTLPFGDLWTETIEHLRHYREYRLSKVVSADENVNDSDQMLAFLIGRALCFNCPELTHHARGAALAIARDPNGAVCFQHLLLRLEEHEEGLREAICLARRARDVSTVRHIIFEFAERHMASTDYVVSTQAKIVVESLGGHATSVKEALPPYYSIKFEETGREDNFDAPPGLTAVTRPMWSDDPWTWTTTAPTAFHMLSRASEFDVGLLRRRCAVFMQREGGRHVFGPEAEADVTATLKRLELKFPWRRLMPMAERRGLSKIVGELVAADCIDAGALQLLWSELSAPSIKPPPPEPSRSPEWVRWPTIPRKQYGGIDGHLWLEEAEECLFVPVVEDWLIVAEERYVKYRAHRASFDSARFSVPISVSLDDMDEDLSPIPRLYSIDVPSPTYRAEESVGFSKLWQPYFGDISDAVITLCPFALRDLGWKRSPSNLLDVLDSSGRVAARTVRWVDGTDDPDTYDVEAFGRGQALLVRRAALAQFEAVFGPLRIGVKGIRSVHDGERNQSRTVAARAD
ncbi:P-loop domain-containing protein [Roseomonas populi]|uniref:ATP-binding protein n=1 Tax=Roseomonas populi TaxID=3121582 RepID=A0ABT1X172_9PROT|nr:ATP-binding protein [Roseomonas pecuniae]MCR0981852.1 ATP-binding protein [Roseomonas pecuniae]